MILRAVSLSLAATGLLLLDATGLAAQVVRLPPVAPRPEPYAGRAVSHSDSLVELPQQFPEFIEPENPDRPVDARDGAFQKVIFDSTWLESGSADGFGIAKLESRVVFGLPIPSRRSPLVVTPGFAVNYLDGPVGADLPSQTYEATLQFRWWKRFSPRFGIDFAVKPGVFSDFDASSDEALRFPGHVAAKFEWTPSLDLVLGAAYLDRDDVNVLPIGGLVWRPQDDVKLELVAPRPRIGRRVYWFGAYGEAVQDWIYVAGEFGGGTWAFRRTTGVDDVVNYRDYRAILGWERKALWGLDARLEIGYVFCRKIEFTSSAADVEPDDTLMLRAGLTY